MELVLGAIIIIDAIVAAEKDYSTISRGSRDGNFRGPIYCVMICQVLWPPE
jgi:hypothetical protein